ncbi:hypothetical protein LZ554_007675 [Drepanopeziza brunnea f. sp. 'monogermtubi']|nr:hypothetical protein LZ554_007675 [Drepanopeziza brunnea f. sp. 'monogermtubi']
MSVSTSTRSTRATYQIAHTARCKLQIAADQPDRNLRFILGHAFTLDKLRLRIAEIEVSSGGSSGGSSSSSDSDEEAEEHLEMAHNRVSFQGRGASQASVAARQRSPPPQLENDGMDSDEDEGVEEDTADGEEEGLGLVRFGSAAAQPPRVAAEVADVPIEGEGEIEMGDQQKFSETELKLLCQGEGDEQMRSAYSRVAGCPCHGETGPRVERFWKLPTRSGGVPGPRLAVVQVT